MSYDRLVGSELLSANIELPAETLSQLASYCEELHRWNSRINLTALTGTRLVRRLVVEPVWVGMRLQMSGSLVDIGSGNGSPAIPLTLSRKLQSAHLIEPRIRRAAFLRHLAVSLKIESLRVHRCRFDEVASSLEPVNWITLQGITLTDELLKAMSPLNAVTTKVVWITAGSPEARPSFEPSQRLFIPFTNSELLVYSVSA